MFICNKCKKMAPKWSRNCPVCSAEHTLEKQLQLTSNDIIEYQLKSSHERLLTGFELFNIFFGFILGFTYFLHAMRGAGKTTFLLQIFNFLVSLGKQVVFFSFDEGEKGIREKCIKYSLSHSPIFVYENDPGVIERMLLEHGPTLVVIDSLQSLVKYDNEAVVAALYRLRKEAQRQEFVLIVIGEERKDGYDYLGSTSIAHIADVIFEMQVGVDDEIVISTAKKNRDTDEKISRCFFRKTQIGLMEISENQIGYRTRHNEKEIIGLAAFIGREGYDFIADEITAAMDTSSKKASLIITGMSNAKAKNLFVVLEKFLVGEASLVLRANRTQKLNNDAELACLVVVLSKILLKPIPVDTIFIGGVDNRCYLLTVEGMEGRVKRAEALGYKRIIGPRANSTQIACWEEFVTLEAVWKNL